MATYRHRPVIKRCAGTPTPTCATANTATATNAAPTCTTAANPNALEVERLLLRILEGPVPQVVWEKVQPGTASEGRRPGNVPGPGGPKIVV